jgi:hypothetical protein
MNYQQNQRQIIQSYWLLLEMNRQLGMMLIQLINGLDLLETNRRYIQKNNNVQCRCQGRALGRS